MDCESRTKCFGLRVLQRNNFLAMWFSYGTSLFGFRLQIQIYYLRMDSNLFVKSERLIWIQIRIQFDSDHCPLCKTFIFVWSQKLRIESGKKRFCLNFFLLISPFGFFLHFFLRGLLLHDKTKYLKSLVCSMNVTNKFFI